MKLTKPEIELLRHTLYVHREMVRTQSKLASKESSDKSKRDVLRFAKIIRFSVKLDDKLTDMLFEESSTEKDWRA